MTSDKQYARLLLRPPAFSGDAHFNLHLLASDFLAILALKPGMNLTGTDIPTPGVGTPAPARDESQEALIIPTGRGEALSRRRSRRASTAAGGVAGAQVEAALNRKNVEALPEDETVEGGPEDAWVPDHESGG
uniref:XS domain containing protein-like n=1 Tax=Oryza sativa subsp. japonica TaxID=39947 RepID=Q653W9_ORYSJ|nr:XS domain containing protein-like [Oryza sativa Japonica Group]